MRSSAALWEGRLPWTSLRQAEAGHRPQGGMTMDGGSYESCATRAAQTGAEVLRLVVAHCSVSARGGCSCRFGSRGEC
jgi:hypothetical protein